MTQKRFELINCAIGGVGIQDNTDGYVYDLTNNLVKVLNDLNDENKQLKQYKRAVWDCDSSKIIRVNKNTGEVDLVDKELKE